MTSGGPAVSSSQCMHAWLITIGSARYSAIRVNLLWSRIFEPNRRGRGRRRRFAQGVRALSRHERRVRPGAMITRERPLRVRRGSTQSERIGIEPA